MTDSDKSCPRTFQWDWKDAAPIKGIAEAALECGSAGVFEEKTESDSYSVVVGTDSKREAARSIADRDEEFLATEDPDFDKEKYTESVLNDLTEL
jgi:hypothetical protein